MTLPARIPTGYKGRTIPNPQFLSYLATETYQGPAADYNFRKQTANKDKLVAALAQHGIQFTEVSSLIYTGDRGYNQRFVVMTTHPAVMWYKYVGFIAQSGQNHLFIHGRRIKVSLFLGLREEEQAALVSGSESEIKYYFSGKKLELLDEAGQFWH